MVTSRMKTLLECIDIDITNVVSSYVNKSHLGACWITVLVPYLLTKRRSVNEIVHVTPDSFICQQISCYSLSSELTWEGGFPFGAEFKHYSTAGVGCVVTAPVTHIG